MFDLQKDLTDRFVDGIVGRMSDTMHTAFTMSTFFSDDEREDKINELVRILTDYSYDGEDIEDIDLFDRACGEAGIDWQMSDDEIGAVYRAIN